MPLNTDTMTDSPSTPSPYTSEQPEQFHNTTCPTNELLNTTYPYTDEELLSSQGYYAMGVALTIIAAVGFLWNLLTLIALIKRKKPQHIEFIIKVLLGSDLCMCLLALPFAVASSFGGRWLFGSSSCNWYGFSMFTLAVFGIYILTAICIERYFTVKRITKVPASAKTQALVTSLVVSALGALLCSTPPLLGLVSPYRPEGVGTSCSLDWTSKKPKDQAYFIAILICCFIIPLSVIVTCYSRIYFQVASRPWSVITTKQTAACRRRMKMEIHLAKTIFLAAGSFVLVWSPYAIISFIAVVTHPEDIPAIAYSLPSVFAKCSVFCNSFVYIFMNRDLRLACLQNLGLRRSSVANNSISKLPNIECQLLEPLHNAGHRLEPREACFEMKSLKLV